jgi:hypothetical protein
MFRRLLGHCQQFSVSWHNTGMPVQSAAESSDVPSVQRFAMGVAPVT